PDTGEVSTRAPSSPTNSAEAQKPPPPTRKPTLVPRAPQANDPKSERKSIPPGALAAPPVPRGGTDPMGASGELPAAPPPTGATVAPKSAPPPPPDRAKSVPPPAPDRAKSTPPPRPAPPAPIEPREKSDPPPATMPTGRAIPPPPGTEPMAVAPPPAVVAAPPVAPAPPAAATIEDEPTREEPPAQAVPVLFGDPTKPAVTVESKGEASPRPAPVAEVRSTAAAPSKPASAPPKSETPKSAPATIPPEERTLGPLRLDRVEAFADVPADAQRMLRQKARVTALAIDEEVSGFGVALILSGAGCVCATIADLPASVLAPAAIASTLTSLDDPGAIRVVASAPTEIATWEKDELEQILGACPWVLDEMVKVGDRLASLAGATMGALGDLDESSRLAALERLTTLALAPNEVLIPSGGDLLGLTVVGAGSVVVQRAKDPLDYSAGDIVLPGSLMEGGTTEAAVQAGPEGALVLVTSRRTTMELFSTMPTLLELVR
ncbi:MAG TPA: hypothetical protein VL400_00320, partial [Polyangiaceae bacterium]|nr:hypothetical protein [Polyangiaceae bacterium]